MKISVQQVGEEKCIILELLQFVLSDIFLRKQVFSATRHPASVQNGHSENLCSEFAVLNILVF